MKLLLENWREYLEEIIQFSTADYGNTGSLIGILKNKLGTVYRLGKPLTLKNDLREEYIVTYEHPNWIVKSTHVIEKLKDIEDVVDYLNRERVNFKTAEMVEE